MIPAQGFLGMQKLHSMECLHLSNISCKNYLHVRFNAQINAHTNQPKRYVYPHSKKWRYQLGNVRDHLIRWFREGTHSNARYQSITGLLPNNSIHLWCDEVCSNRSQLKPPCASLRYSMPNGDRTIHRDTTPASQINSKQEEPPPRTQVLWAVRSARRPSERLNIGDK
jgi:hypothetical protein